MLELIHVSKNYKEGKTENVNALIDINLSFPNTGLVVISGASGCGKTTLLNILGGLDRPTTGEVKLNNSRIDNRNEEWWDSFRALYLGFIYQDFNLLENMSVRKNIQLPLDIRMLDEKTKQEMTKNIVDELGLNSYLEKKAKKIFIIECLIISFSSFFVAIIASIIITNIINNFVGQNILEIYNYNFIRVRLVLVIIIGIINCVLSICSVIIPIKKYSKTKIVDLIK